MGTVFAATHKNNGSRAAIKVLHPEFARDDDTKSRFIQEGYAANQVGHSGVVRILDDDTTEDGLPYIVLELLDGELLEQRRISMGGKLPYEDVYEVAEQLLEVMVAAHGKGIVHRDLKPDNIFVTNDGYLKVLDFGFARMRDGLRKEQTATGFLLGTPGFMSPEQAAGTSAKIDARTDIWAIGATLFVLLTGQPVHEGETAAEMLVAAANFAVRPIGELEPGIPGKFRQVVDKALAFDRNDRFTDARSMLKAVRAIPAPVRAPPPAYDEQSDPSTLMRASPVQAHQDDPTVMGRVGAMPIDASLFTPTSKMHGANHGESAFHPADTEQSTLAIDPHAATIALEHLALPEARAAGTTRLPKFSEEEEGHDRTVMMSSRPQLGGLASPLGAVPPPPQSSSPRVGSAPSYPELPRASYPDLSRAPPPAPSSPQLMPYQAQAQIQPPPRSAPAKSEGGFGNVLVFIAVAGITMVVVILTGLVVILGTE
jgi:serine/threonine-protein kinase